MIDLTNKYVPNVDNELRAEFIKEAEKQGIRAYSPNTLRAGPYLALTTSTTEPLRYQGVHNVKELELFRPEPKADWQNKTPTHMNKEEVLQFVQDFYDDSVVIELKYRFEDEWHVTAFKNPFCTNTRSDVIFRIKPTKSKDQREREEKVAKLEATIKEAMAQVAELKKEG